MIPKKKYKYAINGTDRDKIYLRIKQLKNFLLYEDFFELEGDDLITARNKAKEDIILLKNSLNQKVKNE